jgi:acetyl esterase/lipase
MLDSARAVQFLRSKAKDWNIDPARFAATGGSAGAGISLWLGFHDDLAKPASADPVERQSTRLTAMGVLGAQSSYDPRVIAEIISPVAAAHPALPPFFGVESIGDRSPRAIKHYEDSAAINHLTADDAPAFLFYSEADGPIAAGAKPGTGIHHPAFGRLLKAAMDKLGIECEVHHRDEYQGDGQRQMYGQMAGFFEKYFGK